MPVVKGTGGMVGGQGAQATAGRLFEVPDPPANTQAPFSNQPLNPNQKYELLTKMYGNVTTRSNVFAVWCTIGFFRVIDDSVRPTKLGEELGLSTATNVRHRLFAVIDRTRMTIAPQVTATIQSSPTGAVGKPGDILQNGTSLACVIETPGWLQINAPDSNSAPGTTVGTNNLPWAIRPVTIKPNVGPTATLPGPGSTIVLDYGTQNEETVTVQTPPATAPPLPGPGVWVYATFHRPHGVVYDAQGKVVAASCGNVPITYQGNPGPQSGFNLSSNPFPGLVIAFQVLQ
jgi:hypothetical protein